MLASAFHRRIEPWLGAPTRFCNVRIASVRILLAKNGYAPGNRRSAPQMSHLLAYIDAGSGSLIVQALIATVVAIPFFFRQQIGRVVRAVRRDDREATATSDGRSESRDLRR
jgi:hypothetical protein